MARNRPALGSCAAGARLRQATDRYVADRLDVNSRRAAVSASMRLSERARMWSSVAAGILVVASVIVGGQHGLPWLPLVASCVAAAIFWWLLAGASPDGRWFQAIDVLMPRLATVMLITSIFSGAVLLAAASWLTLAGPDRQPGQAVFLAGFGLLFVLASTAFTRSPVSLDDPTSRLALSTLPDAVLRVSALAGAYVVLAFLAVEGTLDSGPTLSAALTVLGLGGVGLVRSLVRRRKALSEVAVAADGLILELTRSTGGDEHALLAAGLRLDRALRTGVDSTISPFRVQCGDARTSATILTYLAVILRRPSTPVSDNAVVMLVRDELRSEHSGALRAELLELVVAVRSRVSNYLDAVV
jgi:hypothetical protein